jgi:hypothetical protein
MIGILMVVAALMFIACVGMFIAFMRTHSYEISETFYDIVEAIQDIKAYKASKMK